MTSNTYRAAPVEPGSRHLWGMALLFLLTLTAFAVSLFVAHDSAAARTNVRSLYGPSARMGNGFIRTFVQLDGSVPLEVGVAISRDALEALPGPHDSGGIEIGPHLFAFVTVLDLPEPNPTPYRKVVVDWNPGGHEPPGIYDTPHFDFHFNMISEAERLAITPDDPDFDAKAERHPSEAYMPEGFMAIPGGVPLMGTHWIDPNTPELNGQPFTQTLIYGSWDGRLIFVEPMMTRAYLEGRPDFEASLPLPRAVQEPGYHPSSYAIRWDEGLQEWRISLGRLVKLH